MSNEKLSVLPYKGTRDFYPEDMRLRNWFFDSIRSTLCRSAYEEYNGPMLESLDIYAAKSGEELAGEQTYNFTDKGGRRMAIRPEMTPTVSRLVAARLGELNFPLKWFSIQNMYRCERPQRGRLREFWQVNVDIFGCDTYEADLEIIASAVRILRAFGADESMFRVHINNRRFFNDVIANVTGRTGEDAKAVSKIVDRKNKITREEYIKQMNDLGIDDGMIAKIDALYAMSVEEAVSLCPDSVGAKELSTLFASLKTCGMDRYCVFDFGIIRGLDYYTGTVFEVFDEAPENNRAMFGGGRYDNLVGLFVKNAAISGVGYGMGDVTLENFLTTHNLLPATFTSGKKVLITRFDDVPFEAYQMLAEKLLDAGIETSVFLGNKKFGKQIDHALKGNFTHVLIMGATEKEAGIVKVKNLGTREETELPESELIAYFA